MGGESYEKELRENAMEKVLRTWGETKGKYVSGEGHVGNKLEVSE